MISIRHHDRPYRITPNPYSSGTPVQDEKMFFGRREDLRALREKLSSMASNKVVVLYGQRRMGKTSLIYQLAGKLAQDGYLPVMINMQLLSLKENAGQFLYGFAGCISE